MFVYGIVIIQVLVYLANGYTLIRLQHAVNCSNYIDVTSREWYCRDRNINGSLFHVIDRLFMNDWTDVDLRAGLQTACRNTYVSFGLEMYTNHSNSPIERELSSLYNYTQCTMELAAVCPSMPIADAITAKVKTFCTNGTISPLLNQALSVPINFERSCVDDMRTVMVNTSCMQSLLTRMYPYVVGGNLSTIVQHSDNFTMGLYGCIKETLKAMELPVDPTQCDSTWQELTFGFLLSFTGSAGLGSRLQDAVLSAIIDDLDTMNNAITNRNNVWDTMFW